jgi:hypothetical protein
VRLEAKDGGGKVFGVNQVSIHTLASHWLGLNDGREAGRIPGEIDNGLRCATAITSRRQQGEAYILALHNFTGSVERGKRWQLDGRIQDALTNVTENQKKWIPGKDEGILARVSICPADYYEKRIEAINSGDASHCAHLTQ